MTTKPAWRSAEQRRPYGYAGAQLEAAKEEEVDVDEDGPMVVTDPVAEVVDTGLEPGEVPGSGPTVDGPPDVTAAAEATVAPGADAVPEAGGDPPFPSIDVEVVWGDLTRTDGDVYVVGHYQGVLPTGTEAAMDKAISGSGPQVLTEHARRGLLRGELGDVDFFPWPREGVGGGRAVTVVGMGHPGSFGNAELRKISRNLIWAISDLQWARTLCTVPVGSGANNMELFEAVDGFLRGLSDAIGLGKPRGCIERVRIVERFYDRAQLVFEALTKVKDLSAVSARINVNLGPEVVRGDGGDITEAHALSLVLAATALAVDKRNEEKALGRLLGFVPDDDGLREHVRRHLGGLPALVSRRGENPLAVARDISVRVRAVDTISATPARVSFVVESGTIRAAAVTDTATVAERVIGTDLELVRQAVSAMAAARDQEKLARFLAQLVVPRDFRRILAATERPMVLEVDRTMATLHWEMLPLEAEPGSGLEPIGLRAAVARQLRTTYSPPPSPEWQADHQLRALVIGDPGDPEKGKSLPGARKEAVEVAKTLTKHGVETTLLLGAPPRRGQPPPDTGVPPASRLEVLRYLIDGGFDLVHYTGHGTFDSDDLTSRAGWLFSDGLLTARELEAMERPPRLVVANACFSGRMSEGGEEEHDAGLLPSLADEFLRRGVRNYVGTAWRIDDRGAVLFARVFYDTLLAKPDDGRPPATLGAAVFEARRTLFTTRNEGETAADRPEKKPDMLWAAYQHYGDPTFLFIPR